MNSLTSVKSHNIIDIGGILVSSLEFPGKISLVIFTAGCMLRCPYCHNPGIIDRGYSRTITEIFKEIDDSIDFIDSVVITGGEPLIQKEEVLKIIKYCKDLQLNIKLDTNGYYPEKLEDLMDLVDYIALDIKAPFNKYEEVTGQNIGENVRKSMEICLKFPETIFECRTTYVPGLMDPDDIVEIAYFILTHAPKVQHVTNAIFVSAPLITAYSILYQEIMKEMPLYECNIFSTFEDAANFISYDANELKNLIKISYDN